MTRKYDELKAIFEHFDDRKARALERQSADPRSCWCFALLGFTSAVPELRIEPLAIFRKVVEPPGEVELAGALRDGHLLASVSRYSHMITHELAIYPGERFDTKFVFNFSWWIISALRVRTLAELLVPVAANTSWSVISAAADHSVDVKFVEDIPRAHRFGPPVVVTENDLLWVENNIIVFVELLEVQCFRFAVEALSTCSFQSSRRMSSALIWSGIESLFNIKGELKFRLATYIASLLEARGQARVDMYKKITKLYDFRSKAVHGDSVTDTDVSEHICLIRVILSRLLCKIVELGKVPSKLELESAVFQ